MRRRLEGAVAGGHIQEESSVKGRLENGPDHVGPVPIVLEPELPSRARGHDLQKPRVDLFLREKLPKLLHDGLGQFLEPVHLEALVVEAVDGILVAPGIARFREELVDVGPVESKVRKQLRFGCSFASRGPEELLETGVLLAGLEFLAALMLES